MKIKHIDHIGIAVKSIEQAGKFYTDVLGLKIMDIENVADQKVNVAFCRSPTARWSCCNPPTMTDLWPNSSKPREREFSTLPTAWKT